MDFIESIYKYLTSNGNPVLTSVVSLYGLGIMTWFLRNVPSGIINWCWGQMTTTVVINNSDNVYYSILQWIAKHKMHRMMRKYVLGGNTFWGGEEILSLGYDRNVIWFRRPIFITRQTQESQGISRVKETMVLTMLGRNRQIFHDILAEIEQLENADTSHLTVYRYSGDSWQPMVKIPKRSMETIIAPQKVKADLIEHIERFMAEKDWYVKNGVPHRTGVLLFGPPGTGKTSTVTALCSHFDRDCYVIDLSSVSDEKLVNALAILPENSFILMEDIDATLPAMSNREKQNGEDVKAILGVSLAGVLNAIDGVCCASSRIIFATTNHPERLDPALVREGRFNLKAEMGYMTDAMLHEYMTRLYDHVPDIHEWHVKSEIAPCKVQQLVFDNRHDPGVVLEQVAYKVNAARV